MFVAALGSVFPDLAISARRAAMNAAAKAIWGKPTVSGAIGGRTLGGMDAPGHEPDENRRPWRTYRSPHRRRSHDEAHAGDEQAHGGELIPEHPLVPRGEPEVVVDDAGLRSLVVDLRAAASFGYDSEFIGEQTYYPKLCLLQVSLPSRVTLIDPMKGMDLRPFWDLLTDDSIEKIVHAGTPDLEPAFRHTGKPPRNIVDVQIAAGFAGLHFPMGLSKLVAELAGIELAQSPKFSQWDLRPLSARQLRYAANDVRYLPLARSLLVERLQAQGAIDWAMRECGHLSDPGLYTFDAPSQRMRVRGVEGLRPKQQVLLQSLLEWRERIAREHDVPPRAMIRDDVLMAMTRNPAKTVADLDAIKGLPRPVEDRYGRTIVELTEAALTNPAPASMRRKRPWFDRDEWKPQIDALFAVVESACRERRIHPAVVGSKKDVAKLIQWHVTMRQAGSEELLADWRGELLAEPISRWLSDHPLTADSREPNKP